MTAKTTTERKLTLAIETPQALAGGGAQGKDTDTARWGMTKNHFKKNLTTEQLMLLVLLQTPDNALHPIGLKN